jgi:hypothetical protein
MVINPFMFLIDRSIAQGRGASVADANRAGLIGSVLRPPILGILVASAITGNTTPPPAAIPGRGVPKPLPLPGPVMALGMPSFHGLHKGQAEKLAKALNLTLEVEGGHNTGIVEWQEPGIFAQADPGGVLKVRLSGKT